MTIRQYEKPLPRTWWLRKRTYLVFMVRELTSIFLATYALFLILILAQSDGSLAGVYTWLQSPSSILLHAVVLVMALIHTVTWINLTPKVLVLWRGDEQIRPLWIASANYAGWLVASALILWLALR